MPNFPNISNPLAAYVNLNTILVFVVYSLNFLMLVGAVAMIYICLSESRQKDIMENVDFNFEFLVFFTNTLIIIAVVIAFVSFLGCVGIAIDNDYMLIAYIIVIGVLMAAQIFLSSYLSHKLVGSEEDMRKKILTLIKGYTMANPNKLDGFQNKYACCGIDDYRDYLGDGGIGFIPGSCCQKKSNENCASELVHSKKGCSKAIMDEIAKILKGAYIVIFIIFGLEVVLAICSILVIMDVGQPDEDNTSDEIVVVASIRKKVPHDDVKYQESIDTHDSDNIQSPIAKEEEIEGLYDEEKVIQKTTENEVQDEESHEDENDTKQNTEEEILAQETTVEVQEDETSEVENIARNAQDEEIYMEGTLDGQNPQQTTNAEHNIDETLNEEKQYARKGDLQKSDDEDEEEEEEEEEEESPVAGNQTKSEENIQVLKSKRSDRKKYGEKVRKERNRDRKRFK